MINDILAKAQQMLPQIVKWRRHIHANPELSFQENATADYIASVLDSYRIPYIKIAGTGIMAYVDGITADRDRPVVLRADIDALPITETTGLEYASQNEAMHACGHDMHAASLLGALVILRANAGDFEGTIIGLFQPGEELHPGGASIVLGEGHFDNINPKAFVGQHVSPELEVGTFGFHSGTFMASSDEIHLTVKGQGGHAALPHLLTDPVVAAADIIMSLQQVVSRYANTMIPSVLSIGKVTANGATNIIPDQVSMLGTFRTLDEEWRAKAKQRIRAIVEGTATAHGVTAELEIKDGYPCVFNDPALTAEAVEKAKSDFPEESVIMIGQRMTAEDFGYYSVRFSSVFYRLGVGQTAPLHNSGFCPDERALAYGTAMLMTLGLYFLEK